jgi:Mrp family chromosome partitioning ATPase
MIAADERRKMLAVPLCGERVLLRLESIGVARLTDLRGRDPWEVMHEINLEAGRPIWRTPMAVAALQNLIVAAERESAGAPARGRTAHAGL